MKYEICVSKDAIEIIKKVCQVLLLTKEQLANVVYGSEDQWDEDKLKRTCDDIDELCKKYHFSGWPWTNIKIKRMGNCPSKLNDKPFSLHTPPMTAGHLKEVASSIRKNPVKYFASGIHRSYGYEWSRQSIKSNLMDVHDRFSSQPFELLDGGTHVIKSSVIKK